MTHVAPPLSYTSKPHPFPPSHSHPPTKPHSLCILMVYRDFQVRCHNKILKLPLCAGAVFELTNQIAQIGWLRMRRAASSNFVVTTDLKIPVSAFLRSCELSPKPRPPIYDSRAWDSYDHPLTPSLPSPTHPPTYRAVGPPPSARPATSGSPVAWFWGWWTAPSPSPLAWPRCNTADKCAG